MSPDHHLQVPLPLAEMLHVVLGPLAEQLEREGHGWAPTIKRVLQAYTQGRDEILAEKYGSAILQEIDVCTRDAAEQLCQWVAQMAQEESDFELWAQEFLHGNETAS